MASSLIPKVSHPTDRPNFTRVEIGSLTLWYSYQTVIAFHSPNCGMRVSENLWSNTTGKHINQAIHDAGAHTGLMRIRREVFDEMLSVIIRGYIVESYG